MPLHKRCTLLPQVRQAWAYEFVECPMKTAAAQGQTDIDSTNMTNSPHLTPSSRPTHPLPMNREESKIPGAGTNKNRVYSSEQTFWNQKTIYFPTTRWARMHHWMGYELPLDLRFVIDYYDEVYCNSILVLLALKPLGLHFGSTGSETIGSPSWFYWL
uniref:holocytochrome-c synthase n=1 Tax=Oncorhynchus tshawytscha TaxID=74940 RepID=A0AAZ3PAF9_ONCTS